MAQGNTLVTKLKDALKAVNEAPASMQNQLKDVKRELTLVIQRLGTTPGPTPNVDN